MCDSAIERRGNVLAAKRKAWLNQGALPTKLIDDREYPECSSIEQLIMDKVHAPALVRALRHGYDAAVKAHMLATAHAHAHAQLQGPLSLLWRTSEDSLVQF